MLMYCFFQALEFILTLAHSGLHHNSKIPNPVCVRSLSFPFLFAISPPSPPLCLSEGILCYAILTCTPESYSGWRGILCVPLVAFMSHFLFLPVFFKPSVAYTWQKLNDDFFSFCYTFCQSLTKVHLNVKVGNGVSCENLKTDMSQTSLLSKVSCLGVGWLSFVVIPKWSWGSSCWVPGCISSGVSGQSMKVNTCLLLLKHRMDGAVTSYLLCAFQAYHLGTGATFIRI